MPWIPVASSLADAILMWATLWIVDGFPNAEYAPMPIFEVRLVDAEAHRVELFVGSCNGGLRATIVRGSEYVEVKVTAFKFTRDQDDCLDVLEVLLNQSDIGPMRGELLDVQTKRDRMLRDVTRRSGLCRILRRPSSYS